MELTDNDKQRIKKEGERLTRWETGYAPFDSSSDFYKGVIKGAEYATLYERQQQQPPKPKETLDEIAYRLYKTDYKYVSLDSCKVKVLETFINLLEAERTELRNKVIELTRDKYLKLIGAGPFNEPAYTIWETLEAHGYKITK